MVTRNIAKDTPVQVNADLIGVLVHPNTNPPTVTEDGIVVDYTYTKFIIANGVPDPSSPSKYLEAITDTNNNVYYHTGEITQVDGQSYHRWALWTTDGSSNDSVWTKDYPVKPGLYLYNIDITDEQNPAMIGEVGTVGSNFLDNGGEILTDIFFIQIGENNVYSPMFGLNYYVDGDFLIDTHNQYKVGYVVSGPTAVTEPDFIFSKGDIEEGYQVWISNDILSENFDKTTLYTPTDSPAVGDKALFTLFEAKYEYNPQTIKAINKTETPAFTDPVDCILSYSVDGSTWTDWPENITEDNNVIANIPRYMYLKFSQDVVITVE